MCSKFWASKLKSEVVNNNYAEDDGNGMVGNQKAGAQKVRAIVRQIRYITILVFFLSLLPHIDSKLICPLSHSRHATTLIISLLSTSPCQPLNLLLVRGIIFPNLFGGIDVGGGREVWDVLGEKGDDRNQLLRWATDTRKMKRREEIS